MSSTALWDVHRYVIPASYPRGFRRGVRDSKRSRLKLHVKQYVPKPSFKPSNSIVQDDDGITLIAQHGMPPAGFKEAFEPFFADLLEQPDRPPIKAIWAFDVVSFGESYLSNKNELGDEHHWFDVAHDLLQVVNYFQDKMQPPIIGFGQSWGANSLILAASWSPRLFYGIIIGDAVIPKKVDFDELKRVYEKAPAARRQNMFAGVRFANRRTKWNSMHEAVEWHRKSKAFLQYDARVLNLILRHELQEQADGTVELIPPNAQIVSYFFRPIPPLTGIVPNAEEYSVDEDYTILDGFGFFHSERTEDSLKSISSNVLYLWSSEGPIVPTPGYQQRLVNMTGTGEGGAGGKASGQVQEVSVKGGHSLPYFAPRRTAEAVSKWLNETCYRTWLEEMKAIAEEPCIQPFGFSEEYRKRLKEAVAKL